jgi:dinuclear metal center YbgI/SA1388 family protein
MQIHELEAIFEELWPSAGAEEWDAPGFSVSIPSEVSKVLLSVDVTGAVVAEAEKLGAQLIVAHHPLLLRGTNNVNWDDLKGNVLQHAIRSGISIYAAHTNADIVENGVSDTIAKTIGLHDVRPLFGEGNIGHGRIGHFDRAITLRELAQLLASVLPFSPRGVVATGNPDSEVQTVALCGGAGDSFIENAFESGADVYITSDLRHHVALDAISRPRADQPMHLIDISHWASESLWLEVAREALQEAAPSIEFEISQVVTDPWSFSINRSAE